jgi:hypothetical protein
MKVSIAPIGSVCGNYVEYRWLVADNGKIIAAGFTRTIEAAKLAVSEALA